MGNRALIIFTDGEELSGDAAKTAKAAADAGVRIFTVGVGTPQGSLIPVTGDNGEHELRERFSGPSGQIKIGRQTFTRNGGGNGRILSASGKRTTHDAADSE